MSRDKNFYILHNINKMEDNGYINFGRNGKLYIVISIFITRLFF